MKMTGAVDLKGDKVVCLSRSLSALGLFRGLLSRPLFAAFLSATDPAREERARLASFGEMVNIVYAGGGSLSECVTRAVLEDENSYVKARAAGHPIPVEMENALSAELALLSELASLTPGDFDAVLSRPPYLPPFASEVVDLHTEYEKRVSEIGKYGYGMFASYGMFRIGDGAHPALVPILTPDTIALGDFIGYEEERGRVLANTEAFLSGKPAANVLLYGDAGTGKSSSVKAIANHFFDKGLRLVEMRKDQLSLLPFVMGEIGENPLKFIIFIDDLSFNRSDDCFSMLKAALEGSASAKAPNAVIYATSNRRHIVKESFGDRDGGDVHRNDTMQETLSLSERFGLTVLFARPNKQLYLEIIRELAAKRGVTVPAEELERGAEAFALARGTRSARCAEQYIESLM